MKWDGVQQTTPPIPNPGSVILENISPNEPISYSLVSIEDLGTGCSNTAEGDVEVLVSLNVEAGSPYDEFEICDNVNFNISLFENLIGFDYGGVWTDASGVEYPNGGISSASLTPGTYTYTYSIDAEAPCPDDMAQVDVIIHPAPVADAGEDIMLDCNLTSTEIGGTGTSPGYTYSWEGDDVSDATIANPVIDGAGEFILTVTTPFNCVDRIRLLLFFQMTNPTQCLKYQMCLALA